MEKLMKPAEYAKELGISRQAVYAKIKRGILTAKDVEGKLYIVVDTEEQEKPMQTEVHSSKNTSSSGVKPKVSQPKKQTPLQKDYEALLAAKDETISVLKGTVKDLKKSNKQISTTLRSEIDLLKEAFHEMRTLYMHQLEHKKPDDMIDVLTEEIIEENVIERIGVKKLFKAYGIEKKKAQEKVLKRLKKAWKAGDERIVKENGKFRLDAYSDYLDIVK